MKCVWLLGGLLGGLCFLAPLEGVRGWLVQESSPEPQLCQGDYWTEPEARAQLERFAASYSNLEEWLQRADRIREGILRGAELDPLPERTPLRPLYSHYREHRDPPEQPGYSVQNVAFESLPGVFVTGSLYRPLGLSPPFAGVLSAHGHWNETGDYGRFRADAQIRAATLARMGAVVLAWDMVGYGELREIGWQHDHPQALKQQIWNGLRALDFVAGLPEVDPSRIAVTGASGGATQAFLLTALDDRIAVAAPVVQISAHFFGGCVCESGMPIHKDAGHQTNNVEIAALAAPRPLLVVSDGEDWTRNTPEVEFPYIREVYRLFGAEDRVLNVHLANEGHDYGPSKRSAVYRFLGEHLGLSPERVAEGGGFMGESTVVIEAESELHVFGDHRPLPGHAVRGNEEAPW